MRINRVFDVEGPGGFTPNSWNYNYSEDFFNSNYIIRHDFINNFTSKYGTLSVYDCNMNISEKDINNIHISDINYNEHNSSVNNENEIYFYTIHPFGDIQTCLGNQLNYHQNLNSLELISEKAKYYLKKAKNFYIIFDYSSEGNINKDIFESLHNICDEIELDVNKIVVITSALNTTDIYNEYLNENPKDKIFYTANYTWSLLTKRGELNHLLHENDTFEFNGFKNNNSLMTKDECIGSKDRKKKALILNRRIALHRAIILSLLQSDNLLNETMSSFDLSLHSDVDELGADFVNDDSHPLGPFLMNDDYRKKLIEGYIKLKRIGKRIVDFEDIKNVWGFGFENKNTYLNTYFSVITETLFYEKGVYISEKTFKGISHLHPFVIVGKQGTLKKLREWGFKTFSDFWDESYDEIEDNALRMDAVYTLIKSLIEKSNKEWDSMMDSMIDILEYNRKHLVSCNEDVVNDVYINNLNKLLQNEPNKENYFLF